MLATMARTKGCGPSRVKRANLMPLNIIYINVFADEGSPANLRPAFGPIQET